MEAILTELPKQNTLSGVLLILLTLAISLLIFAIRMLLMEKDKRIEDQKTINDAFVNPIKAIQESSEKNTKVLSDLLDTVDDIRRQK